MDLYLLAELKTISLKVQTVDMLKPPVSFVGDFVFNLLIRLISSLFSPISDRTSIQRLHRF